MNKLTSGILAIGIYFILLFLVLLYYNVHKIKAKNYVEKNSNRITVTLVNSDKTVFNKSSKITIPKKPTPRHHISKPKHHAITPLVPKKHIVKPKIPPKRNITPSKKDRLTKAREERKKLEEAKKIARAKARRERERQEREAQAKKETEKKKIAEARAKKIKEQRERERLANIAKKKKEQQERAKEARRAKELERIKKEKEKKERARLARIKKEKEKKERARLARIRAEEDRKKRAKERSKNLFSSIKTHTTPRAEPKRPRREQTSQIRHNSSVADRIKNTHQSGRVSNKNRERGVVNAYIAKVQKQLNNWNAQSNYKGQSATIKLTIMSSGHFRYTVRRSSSGALSHGLRTFLDQLNRIGLGRHNKSTPYIIEVTFRAR